MKTTIAVLVLAFSVSGIAAGFPKETKFKCEKAMTGTVNTLEVKFYGDWKKNFYKGQDPAYSSATNKVGQWIVIEKNAKGPEAVVVLSPTQNIRYTYNPAKNCEATVSATPIVKTKRGIATQDIFDDAALEELIKSKKNGIIFIWSPHMALSLKAVPELNAAAAELGQPVTYIMDPLADQEAAKAGAKEQKMGDSSMRRVDSMELAMRNALVHYPTLIVYRDGKICDTFQRGYRTAEKYRAIITKIFGKCE